MAIAKKATATISTEGVVIPAGVPESFDEHVKLHFDLQRLAFQADITRVSTVLYARDLTSRSYPESGVHDGFHGISHHAENPETIARYAKLNQYHIKCLAYFVEKLKNTPDGDGTLLDHSLDPVRHQHGRFEPAPALRRAARSDRRSIGTAQRKSPPVVSIQDRSHRQSAGERSRYVRRPRRHHRRQHGPITWFGLRSCARRALLVYASALACCLPTFAANSPLADAAMNGDRMAVRSADPAEGRCERRASRWRNRASSGLFIVTTWRWPVPLIAAGADIKLANREGATPMYLAALHGSAPMIEKLLKAGADVNQLGPEGETPLMLSARTGNLEAIRLLLDHHADVNSKDKLRGTTALMWATDQVHPEAVKLLIEHGASVSAQTEIDTRNARNNLANTVKQRLHSSFGVFGKRGPGNDGTPAQPEGQAAPKPPPAPAPAGPAVAGTKSPASEANNEDEVLAFFRRPAKKDGGGLTPLVYAARENCMECAKESGGGGSGRQSTNVLRLDAAAGGYAEPAL